MYYIIQWFITFTLFGIWNDIKGIVHPKMKITPLFTHPQAILGVHDKS